MKHHFDHLYWVWLSLACGTASKAVPTLMERYEDPFDLYRLDEEEIEQMEGIRPSLKGKLAQKSLERSYAILHRCQEEGIEIIPYADPRYPARLRAIVDPPLVLYCKGKLPDLESKLCVGMVGTRKMSEYGKQSAYTISYELAATRAVVVSGMAKGVDAVCSCGALTAGGETVVVLGSGVNVIYPKVNTVLYQQILKHGAVISEYPPDTDPFAGNFPKRNRIISGLSHGVVVIEGKEGSGSLITADYAIEQGREIFALPGQVDVHNSEGPNNLIQKGARMARSARDVVNFYEFLFRDELRYKALEAAERKKTPCEQAMETYGLPLGEDQYQAEKTKKSVPRKEKATTSVTENPQKTSTQAKATADEKAWLTDRSEEILASMDEISRRVFARLPVDHAVSPDALTASGIGIGDVLIALSMLEINGLVASLPGGMYIRK